MGASTQSLYIERHMTYIETDSAQTHKKKHNREKRVWLNCMLEVAEDVPFLIKAEYHLLQIPVSPFGRCPHWWGCHRKDCQKPPPPVQWRIVLNLDVDGSNAHEDGYTSCVYVCVEKRQEGCVTNGFISTPFFLTCGSKRQRQPVRL